MPAVTATVLAVAGLATAGVGAYSSYEAAQKQEAAQGQILAAQQQQEDLRKQAMELDARRKSMEALRNQQRARALALATATSQGAQFGSGLPGAYGQIQGQSGNNLLGISQGLSFGEQNFGLNSQISSARLDLAAAQSQAYTGSALTGFGNSLISNLGTINRIGQEFNFGSSSSSSGSSFNPYYGTNTSRGAIF